MKNYNLEKYTLSAASMLEKMLDRLNAEYALCDTSDWHDGNFCGMATAMNMMGYDTRYDAEQGLWVLK